MTPTQNQRQSVAPRNITGISAQKTPGKTDLVFEYDRPWARAAAAARTFSVSVHVGETSSDAAHQST